MNEDLSGIFKPEAKTIRKIFGDSDSYYIIPDYQRPYSWENEHIEQLWDDIVSAMESGEEMYFLGPIILIKTKEGFEVVDGQQRLITLTILFCVLRDLYFKEDSSIINSIKSLIDQKYRLRLIIQPHYQNKFEEEILKKINFPQKTLSLSERKKNKFINAALIFKDKLEELENDEKRKELVDYILDKIVMITIICSEKSYAIKLFQILNARGLDLSPADLIKSYLYGQCDEDKRCQFIATWRQIEDLSDQIEESITNLLTYYEYFLLAENPRKSLYEELEKQFKNKDPNEIVYNFKNFVEHFKNIYEEESKLIFSFNYLPNQVFWKAILTTAKNEQYVNYDELCKELQRMYYCYWIAGYTTSKVKQLSFNIIKWIKQKKDIDFIKNEIEKKLKEHNVISRMTENLNNDVYGQSWLKPILILIEYNQTDESKISFINADKRLHIDHILPEKWDSITEWKELWNKEEADTYLNKLGNLTLLSGKKNIAQRNDPPSKKKEMYEKGHGGKTAFEISKRVIEALKNGWRKEDVDERHRWLIGEINSIFGLNIKGEIKNAN